MKRFGATSGRVVALVSGAVVVFSASLWAIVGGGGSSDRDGPSLPENLTVASLAKQAKTDPGVMRRTIRETMESEGLTDEQRRQAGRNMGQVWRGMMDERVDEYLNAPEDQRVAVLDRQIDEFQERMKEWQKERETRRREREARGDQGENDRRERGWGRGRSTTRAQRKQRSESRDPDRMGRRIAHRTAMRERMQQRGIEMPFGPGRRGSRGGRNSN